MDNFMKKKMQVIYLEAQKYLLEILPSSINEKDLESYYKSDNCEFSSLKDVYEQLISSAQNYRGMPNVIKFSERKETLKRILYGYDFEKIRKMSVENLYYTFREEFCVTSRDSKYNSWWKWSNSVIDAANFMSNFKDVNDFRKFVNQFSYNLLTKMALPLLISREIHGIGFSLACDTLKELGYQDYPKPDVHLKDVFYQLGLSESKEDIEVFEKIVTMADVCKEIDSDVTPYKVDKILWLICSGNFYKEKINVGRHKEDFIKHILCEIDNNC